MHRGKKIPFAPADPFFSSSLFSSPVVLVELHTSRLHGCAVTPAWFGAVWFLGSYHQSRFQTSSLGERVLSLWREPGQFPITSIGAKVSGTCFCLCARSDLKSETETSQTNKTSTRYNKTKGEVLYLFNMN